MKMLSKSQIIALHGMAIRQTGGSVGLRDEGALDAALAAGYAVADRLEKGEWVALALRNEAA